jgi:hypothetical protein
MWFQVLPAFCTDQTNSMAFDQLVGSIPEGGPEFLPQSSEISLVVRQERYERTGVTLVVNAPRSPFVKELGKESLQKAIFPNTFQIGQSPSSSQPLNEVRQKFGLCSGPS